MLLNFARIDNQNGLHLANQDIDGSAILNKANQFARNLNIVDFKGSEGWLSGLKERVGISQKTKHGESLSAPSQEEIECDYVTCLI